MAGELKNRIGRQVRKVRLNSGLTQARLAELLGKTVETISNIERGRTMPGIATVEALCRHLGITMKEFFDDGEDEASGDAKRLQMERQIQTILRTFSNTDLEATLKIIEIMKTYCKDDTSNKVSPRP